jgi:archaeal flagellar protein FlaJ
MANDPSKAAQWTGESGTARDAAAKPTVAGSEAIAPAAASAALQDLLRGDRRRKGLLDAGILVGLGLLVLVLVSAVELLPLGIGPQTLVLALAAIVLSGSSFLVEAIGWDRLRAAQQHRVLDKGKAELILTITSIAALFTAVVMVIVEILALLVFVGTIEQVGRAGAQFAANFPLVQTIMLLVYLFALLARESNVSAYKPKPGAVLASKILTGAGGLFVLLGVLMANAVVQLSGVEPHQGVYIVTLGVLLEFLAMRIRLRLPSLWSLAMGAVDSARRPTPEMKDELRKRALRTYVIGIVFVTVSMGFAGAIASGVVTLGGGGVTLSLVIFYVGTALILLGLVAVRVFQARNLEGRKKGDEADELSHLVAQKRRSPEEVARMAVYAFTGFLAFVFAVLMVLTAMGTVPWHEKYATDLFILAVVFGAGPFGFYYNKDRKRILAMDDKFPDFLRDIAESARAGMTLPRALVTAATGTYGALTPEIKMMAAQVEWGVEFGDALQRFATRAKTPLIDRTVALIVEAQRAGGSVVDILTAASEDAREIKQIISERNTQMSMYNVVIYISFFVFIAVVLVLSAQFIPAFKTAVGAASGQQVGGLQFRDFDPEDFNTIFFQAALVQAIGGGLVGGVLSKGSPVAGFMHIGVMMIVAWISFRVVVRLMGGGPPVEEAADAVALVRLGWGWP